VHGKQSYPQNSSALEFIECQSDVYNLTRWGDKMFKCVYAQVVDDKNSVRETQTDTDRHMPI